MKLSRVERKKQQLSCTIITLKSSGVYIILTILLEILTSICVFNIIWILNPYHDDVDTNIRNLKFIPEVLNLHILQSAEDVGMSRVMYIFQVFILQSAGDMGWECLASCIFFKYIFFINVGSFDTKARSAMNFKIEIEIYKRECKT